MQQFQAHTWAWFEARPQLGIGVFFEIKVFGVVHFLQLSTQKRGNEVLIDVIDAFFIPCGFGVAVVFIEIQTCLQGLGGGRIGGNIVAGIGISQQISIGINDAFVNRFDAVFVAWYVVLATRNKECWHFQIG